jgi:serine O-acetyltransferase
VFNNLREDWLTYERDWTRRGLWVMVVYRFGNWRYGIRSRVIRCVIRNGVTVGLRHTGQRGAPVIGDRCDIGAGAKLLGDIRIGDDVAIGANAVVIRDVPSNSIAVGVPATVKARKPRV